MKISDDYEIEHTKSGTAQLYVLNSHSNVKYCEYNNMEIQSLKRFLYY